MKYHESIKFNIPINTEGQRDLKISFRRRGICKGMLLVNTGKEPLENIDIQLKDRAGNEILPNIFFKLMYQRQGGSYQDSMLPITFNEPDIVVTFIIDQALAATFKGQLVFLFNSEKQELLENQTGHNTLTAINTKSITDVANCQNSPAKKW